MKKVLMLIAISFIFGACANTDQQIREAMKKNPKLVFDIIEENPEQFIQAVNHAAQLAQQKQIEKQMAEIKSEQEKDLKNPKQPKLSESRLLSGNSNAPIVLVEYADFQCPACGMLYQSLVELKKKHKDEIQFYYKHMPLDFHKMALPAAKYFEAIKDQSPEKALQFYDQVFQNQREMRDESFLKKIASKLKINMSKLEKMVNSEKIKNILSDDENEFQQFGFTGTPVLLVNGVAMHGAQSLAEIEKMIQATRK